MNICPNGCYQTNVKQQLDCPFCGAFLEWNMYPTVTIRRRTWRERLFTRPWQPFRRYETTTKVPG